jgi:hypothetical protein
MDQVKETYTSILFVTLDALIYSPFAFLLKLKKWYFWGQFARASKAIVFSCVKLVSLFFDSCDWLLEE